MSNKRVQKTIDYLFMMAKEDSAMKLDKDGLGWNIAKYLVKDEIDILSLKVNKLIRSIVLKEVKDIEKKDLVLGECDGQAITIHKKKYKKYVRSV